MNVTSTTLIGRHQHPPQSVETRHVGAVDRFALHLGVALITWSRRPRAVESHVAASARASREREAQRLLHLRVPPR